MNGVKFEETDSAFFEAARSKRNRCSNFSAQEKNILIHIVEKYEGTVELKKTDKQSILKKERIWDTIAEEFNEIIGPESLRTAKQLKMCYENLKRRLRKQNKEDKECGELLAVNSENGVSSDSKHDSVLETNSSTDTIRPLLEELCVPEDKLSPTASGGLFTAAATAGDATPPEPGELHDGPGVLTRLRQVLLRKEIALANLDLEMRTRKYELELRVQEAKLEYYRRKTALLGHVTNSDS